MKKLVFLFLALPVLLISCDDYGDKVTIKKSEVFYKGENVKEAEAKELAKYLLKAGWFDEESAKSAQLTKEDETYIVRLVVDEEKVNSQVLTTLWKFQYDMSQDLFEKSKVKISLADSKLKDIEQQLDPIARLKVPQDNYIYYNSKKFKKEDAMKLADFFVAQQYFSGDNAKDILLTMEKKVPVVRFIVNKDLIMGDEEKYLPIFSYLKEGISDSVFEGDDTKVILSTAAYEDFKTVKKLTAEQRDAINRQTTETPAESPSDVSSPSGVERDRD